MRCAVGTSLSLLTANICVKTLLKTHILNIRFSASGGRYLSLKTLPRQPARDHVLRLPGLVARHHVPRIADRGKSEPRAHLDGKAAVSAGCRVQWKFGHCVRRGRAPWDRSTRCTASRSPSQAWCPAPSTASSARVEQWTSQSVNSAGASGRGQHCCAGSMQAAGSRQQIQGLSPCVGTSSARSRAGRGSPVRTRFDAR